jgi:hypothetical protein
MATLWPDLTKSNAFCGSFLLAYTQRVFQASNASSSVLADFVFLSKLSVLLASKPFAEGNRQMKKTDTIIKCFMQMLK